MKTELESLFRSYTGTEPSAVEPLTSSGSNRAYFRLSSPDFSCIGVAGTVAEENQAFCSLARHFASKGINVPEVYAVSRDTMYYLQQDLGRESLFDRIAPGRMAGKYSPEETALLKKTISMLPASMLPSAFSSSSCVYTLMKPSKEILLADTVKRWPAASIFTEVVSYLAGVIRLATKRFQMS